MNNNENNNPQMKIMNELNIANNNVVNNQPNNNNNNRFINNMSNNNSTNLDFDNTPSTNNNVNNNNQNPNPNPLNNMNVEDAKLKSQVVETHDNQYVNTQNEYNETSLNDLNVDGKYNKLDKNIGPSPYSDDAVVRENIENHKKNTVKITVTQEMKIVLIIAAVMFIFILIMPNIFDIIEKIRFH